MTTKLIKTSPAKHKHLNFILEGIKIIYKIEKEPYKDKKNVTKNIIKSIKNKEIIIADLNDKPVAFLQFNFSKKCPYGLNYSNWKNKFGWIEWLYVEKKQQHKKIGTLLQKEFEKECKKRKIKEILLDVYEVNQNARKFYQKNGYKEKIIILSKKIN